MQTSGAIRREIAKLYPVRSPDERSDIRGQPPCSFPACRYAHAGYWLRAFIGEPYLSEPSAARAFATTFGGALIVALTSSVTRSALSGFMSSRTRLPSAM